MRKLSGLLSRIFPTNSVVDLSSLSVLWVIAIIIVNPIGNFPLNDDWSFGISVKRMLEDGVFSPTGWTSMSLITQTLWGTCFTKIFGFSFTVLRFSTLFLSLIGVLSFYLLVRMTNASRYLAIVLSLLLAFNPLYFALSYTFLTDVPFTALSIISILFLFRNLQSDSSLSFLLGTGFAVIAILCRQIGLFIPLAFFVSHLMKNGFSRRNILKAVFPAFVGICSLVVLKKWLEVTGRTPALYGSPMMQIHEVVTTPKLLFSNYMQNSYNTLLYLGLFSLPVLINFPILKDEKRYTKFLLAVTFFCFSFFSLLHAVPENLMPVAGNILITAGIGPLTLYDTYALGLPHLPGLSRQVWIAITVLSVLGGGLVLVHLVRIVVSLTANLRESGRTKQSIALCYLLSLAVIYFVPLFLIGHVFDRYFIPLVFLVLIIIASSSRKKEFVPSRLQSAITICLLGVFCFTSVAITHDYLAWNRARWEGIQELLEVEGINPNEIDGGFEFNGLYLYSSDYQSFYPHKSWWWVHDNTYLVTLGMIPGYDVLKKYPFTHWLPRYKGNIHILRRKTRTSSSPEPAPVPGPLKKESDFS